MKEAMGSLSAAPYAASAAAYGKSKAGNPHEAAWLNSDMSETLNSIRRVDEKGVLYEMDYTADYYDPAIVSAVQAASAAIDTGCSAFSAYNTSKDYLMCRNYDYRHRDANGDYTGLNVVVHTAPKGRLRSVGVCDAYWLNPSAYHAGALDNGVTDTSLMMLAPYVCVDGLNEAGVAAALLVVNLKDGESRTNQNTGKTRVPHTTLLRCIMDNAHTLDEAVKIAESCDVYSIGGSDLHIYVADRSGSSAVLEWRQYGNDAEQKLYVTYTNAVTNFFVGFDDGENVRNGDGSLKELCAKVSPTLNGYRYGYGHGYHRFNGIISALERYAAADVNERGLRNSVMKESQMLDVLRVAAQDPGTEKTSFTQYSAVYNLSDLSVSLRMQKDYDKVHPFKWQTEKKREHGMMKRIFESDSIDFVEVTELLVKDYLTMVNDIEHVARLIGRRTDVISEDQEIEWIRKKRAEKAPIFSMIEKTSGEYIGNIELMDVDGPTGVLGIAITAEKQNRHYGTEAINAFAAYARDQMHLSRICLKVYPDNARAIHVYEKCGFREYGRTDDEILMELTC